MKLIQLIVMVFALVFASSNLFAQNDTQVENMPTISTTEKGVEALLQIQLRLDEMVEEGSEIISQVQGDSEITEDNENIIRMQSLLESLEELKFDIEFSIERFDTQSNLSQEIDEEFSRDEVREEVYNYILEIRTITQEFKSTLRPLINEQRREEIKQSIEERRQEIRESRDDRKEELRARIEQKRKEHIVNRVQELENRTSINGISPIAQQLANGEISIEEFKEEVRKFVNENNNVEERIQERIREERERRNMTQERMNGRTQERIQENIERNKQRRDERIEQRIQRVQERIQERRGDLSNSDREEIEERIDDVSNLTPDDIVEILVGLSPEQQARISAQVGIDISSVPDEVLIDIISSIPEEEMQTYIDQAREFTQNDQTNQNTSRGEQ